VNSKQERFIKVASKRVQYIIDKMDLLGNCSNRNNYDFDEKDVRKMFLAIKESMKRAEMKFEDELQKKQKRKFKF